MDVSSRTNQRYFNVGYVVPTLGKRLDFLKICLNSLHINKVGFIVVVRPVDAGWIDSEIRDSVDLIIDDKGHGLAGAINTGINSLPVSVSFLNWIGDDDFLQPDSISSALNWFSTGKNIVAVFGRCSYVDAKGREIWENKYGRFATTLMKFGPFLIPQPGSLIRSEAFKSVGLLDEELQMTFDLDLFLRLEKIGKIEFLDQKLASYRWHTFTLTAENPKLSLLEGRKVKLKNGEAAMKIFVFVVNPLAKLVIRNGKRYIEARSRVRAKRR